MGAVKEFYYESENNEAIKEYERRKKLLDDKLRKYREAYDIFMDYWDLLPEEALQEVQEKLKEIGL